MACGVWWLVAIGDRTLGRMVIISSSHYRSVPLTYARSNSFFTFKEEVFDTKLFSRGKAKIYSRAGMDNFNQGFQKQLLFNFSECRGLFNSVSHVQISARGGEVTDTDDDSPYDILTSDEVPDSMSM